MMASVLSNPVTKFLLKFQFSTIHRISSDELPDAGGYSYEGRLQNEPSVKRSVQSFNWGDSIEVECDNSDGFYTDLDQAEEVQGKGVTLTRYEPEDSPQISFEFYGVITDYNILQDKATFNVSIQNPDTLQTDLPKKVYETNDWAQSAPLIINPATDLDKAYPYAFGDCRKVPLVYVHADYTNKRFDYIMSPGPIESNNSNKSTKVIVYGSKIVVGSAEYYVHGGETTIQYTDAAFGMSAGAANPYIKNGVSYAFTRFKKEQLLYTGGLDTIYASFWGMKLGGASAERNFIRVIQNLLNNAYWGLNEPINAASFNQAAAAFAAIGGMYCDGFIDSKIKAQDLIEELRQVWGIDLYKNSAGEWCCTVDTYQATTAGTFGDKASGWDNIDEVKTNKKTPTGEAVRNLSLEYGYNQWEGNYTYNNTRTVNSLGQDKALRCRFIRNHTTADKSTCYWQKLWQLGNRKLVIVADMEARDLTTFNTINMDHTGLKITGVRQVRQIIRSLEKFELSLINYASGIYAYTPGTLPVDANDDAETDYSKTDPAAPTNLAIDLSGIESDAYGFVTAYTIVRGDIPSSNASKIQGGFRKNGQTEFAWLDGSLSSGSTWKIKLPGLGQNTGYDYSIRTINTFGRPSSGNPTILNQTSARDGTAPSVPTGLAPTVGTGKMVGLKWTANAPSEGVKEYKVYRNDGPSFNGFVEIDEVSSNRFNDENVTIGLTYRYAVAAVDSSENQSVACAYVSATPVDSGGADTTPPAQIIDFIRIVGGEGTYQTSQGKTLAYISFSWTNPSTHWAWTYMKNKRTGGSVWMNADQNFQPGAATAMIDDLEPGLSYDFTVIGVNRDGVPGTAATTVTRVAPGDTTPPSTVTGLTGSGKLKTWQFFWAGNTEQDMIGGDYHVQISTNVGFTGIVFDKYITGQSVSFTSDTISYGILYCRAKARDLSRNESLNWSSVASATTYQAQTGDYADNSVTDSKVLELSGSKLTISPSINNLVRDGGFELDDMTKEWIGGTHVTSPVNSGKYAARLDGTGGYDFLGQRGNNAYIPVVPGEVYHYEGYHRHSADGLGNSFFYLALSDANKAGGGAYGVSGGDPGTVYTLRNADVIIPAGKFFMSIGMVTYPDMSIGENAFFDDVKLWKKVGASYIEDLAVGTLQLSNSGVTYLKRQLVEEQSSAINVLANGGSQTIHFSHTLGRKALVSWWYASINAFRLTTNVHNNDTAGFDVVVSNWSGANSLATTLLVGYW